MTPLKQVLVPSCTHFPPRYEFRVDSRYKQIENLGDAPFLDGWMVDVPSDKGSVGEEVETYEKVFSHASHTFCWSLILRLQIQVALMEQQEDFFDDKVFEKSRQQIYKAL